MRACRFSLDKRQKKRRVATRQRAGGLRRKPHSIKKERSNERSFLMSMIIPFLPGSKADKLKKVAF